VRREKALVLSYHSLTQAVAGETSSRFLSAELAALARQQIDAGHELRGRVDALREASEQQWADRQLADVSASSGEAKKGDPSGPPKRNHPGNRNAWETLSFSNGRFSNGGNSLRPKPAEAPFPSTTANSGSGSSRSSACRNGCKMRDFRCLQIGD
jgi:hypothetical protein